MANIYTDRIIHSKLAKVFISFAKMIASSRADIIAVGIGVAKHTDHNWHLCVLFVIAYNIAIAALFSTAYLFETRKSNLNFNVAIMAIETLGQANSPTSKEIIKDSIEKGDVVINEFDKNHDRTMKIAKNYGIRELCVCSILGFVAWLPSKETTYAAIIMGCCFYQFVGWAKELRLTLQLFAQAASTESLVKDLKRTKKKAIDILGSDPTKDTQAQNPSEASPA